MAFDKKSLDEYVEVNERIIEFYEKFPNGSIQSEIVEHITGSWISVERKDKYGKPYEARERTDGLIAVKAYAYRTPDDPRPGIGHSWIEIPGSTPYTRTSELENAETSAWGRALAALGLKVKRSIATKDEIENKKQDDVSNGSSEGNGQGARGSAHDSGKTLTPAQAEQFTTLLIRASKEIDEHGQPVILLDKALRAWGLNAVEGIHELATNDQVA